MRRRALAAGMVLAAALAAGGWFAFGAGGGAGAPAPTAASRQPASPAAHGTARPTPAALAVIPDLAADDAAAAPSPAPLASPGCALAHPPGDFVETVASETDPRPYRLHVPPSYDPATPAALVVNFHGYGRSALDQETYSGFVPIADREGFVLVTPEGSGDPPGWDIPGVYDEDGEDDLAMTAALVVQLQAELCVDPARVYATGLSNGAEMAAEAGCRLPDVFAAVAPVAGVVYADCAGGPVALITFHGTGDYNVPFDTAPPAVEQWATHDGCAATPSDDQVSPSVERLTYAGCTAGADVVFYVVHGGGHTWPGAEDDAGGVGPTTHEIAASELIWQFFAAHPKPAP